jgi:hypothetical protein
MHTERIYEEKLAERFNQWSVRWSLLLTKDSPLRLPPNTVHLTIKMQLQYIFLSYIYLGYFVVVSSVVAKLSYNLCFVLCLSFTIICFYVL